MTSVKKNVFIFTSDLAAYIGQNIYDFVTPMERIWKKIDPEYELILNSIKNEQNGKETILTNLKNKKTQLQEELDTKKITNRQYTTILNKVLKEEESINKDINKLQDEFDNIHLTQKQRLEKVVGSELLNIIESKNIETEEKREKANEIINQIPEEKRKFVQREMESFINKTHGTIKEDSAIDLYEKKFQVKLDTSQVFHKNLFYTTDKYNWYIGGKMDGIYKCEVQEDNYIVEVKNRTNGFFNILRDYEKTQIQIYMYLLSYNKAKLVEKYNNKIKITDIYRNDEYITEVLDYLKIFINNFEKFLNNPKLKSEFIHSDTNNKKRTINKMYLNEIEKKREEKTIKKLKQIETKCLINDLDTDYESDL